MLVLLIKIGIVLGCGLHNEAVNSMAVERLDSAIEDFHSKKIDYIVVSGGKAPSASHRITEAQAMMDYLVVRGVSEDRVLKEDQSWDTISNAVFTNNLLEKSGLNAREVVLYTHSFHSWRAEFWFKVVGITAKTRNIDSKTEKTSIYKKTWWTVRDRLIFLPSIPRYLLEVLNRSSATVE